MNKSTTNHYPAFRGKTRQRQIEFMWHLYGQGFTAKEIGDIYNVTAGCIFKTFETRLKKINKADGKIVSQ